RLPPLGLCAVEPLGEGWLLRVSEEPLPRGATHILLDLTVPRRCSVTVSGSAGSWTHELSPRHAELLYLLALHRSGCS
ncbi:transcriptional regulator, partial [Xylella fastidiosa subsp. multiplex]|nr:transcriptional regulator [Xylella fastidiosa subsp. multiplex]